MDPHNPDLERKLAQSKLVGKAVKVTTADGKTAEVRVIGITATERPFARVEDAKTHQKYNLFYDEISNVE